MEDPGAEPEQKRIKRIAEHIEDEIVRAQHLPLEELIRHKAFMVRLLQFLSIEEAYAVSLASRRIYEWFQNNDIWYALAQRWLTPERLAQCEAWVEQVKPKGKRINYLWLLLGEHAERFTTTKPWLTTMFIIYERSHYGLLCRVYVEYSKSSNDVFAWTNVTENISLGVSRHNLARKIYEYLQTHPDTYVALVHDDYTGIEIRTKLN